MKKQIKTPGIARPNFPRMKLTSKQYQKHFWTAMNYAHVELTLERLKKETINWAKSNRYDVTKLNSIDKIYFGTIGKVFYIINNGGEVTDQVLGSTLKIMEEITSREIEVDDEPEVQTIQRDPIKQSWEKISLACYMYEDWVDSYIIGEISDLSKKSPAVAFGEYNINHNQCEGIIESMKNVSEEYRYAIDTDDSEILEAYSHIGKRKLKHIVKFYDEVIGYCQELLTEYEAKRIEASKKTPFEMVSKLPVMKKSEELTLFSDSLEDIIGAREIWVMNTKTRKIGRYVAADRNGFGVSGHNLENYDEEKSLQRTINKPAENIKKFKFKAEGEMAKAFAELGTLTTKMNGKLTKTHVVFKIFK